MRRFVSAAGNRDGIGGGIFEAGRRVAKMVRKREAGGFLDSDAAGANVLIYQSLGGDFRGGLVLLPNADFGGEMQFFAEAALFKSWHDPDRMARAMQHQAHKATA